MKELLFQNKKKKKKKQKKKKKKKISGWKMVGMLHKNCNAKRKHIEFN